MPSTSVGGSVAVSKPTKWRFDTTTGRLQKQDPNSTVWNNFTIKGLNYSATPAGWTPEYPHHLYCSTNNTALIKKLAVTFKNTGCNTLRVYSNNFGQAFQTGGPGAVSGRTDFRLLDQFLDECYKNGIYVLLNTYVSFAYNSSTKDRAYYRSEVTEQMIQTVAQTKNHPAVMGYIFGNETNLGYSLVNETLADWLKLANNVGKEIATLDNGTHLYGPCNVMSTAIINAENNGELNACNVHFFNAYPNPQWNENGTNANDGQFSKWRSQITNNKKFIVTESGYSSYSAVLNGQDEANHALYTGQLWDNYIKPAAPNNGGGQDVCGGVCFFSSNDELFKGGPYLNGVQVGGGVILNDGNYTNVNGYDDSWDTSNPANPVRKFPIPTVGYINPVGDGRFYEQHFGWWKYTDTLVNSTPLVPKQVVATMTTKWL
jgi:hypothetical protein